jgi:hypothetical protein
MLQYCRQPVLKQTRRRTAPNCSLGAPGSPSISAALPMHCSSDATGALTTTLPDTALQANMATMMHWQAPPLPWHLAAAMKDTAMSTPQHGQRNGPTKCRHVGMFLRSRRQFRIAPQAWTRKALCKISISATPNPKCYLVHHLARRNRQDHLPPALHCRCVAAPMPLVHSPQHCQTLQANMATMMIMHRQAPSLPLNSAIAMKGAEMRRPAGRRKWDHCGAYDRAAGNLLLHLAHLYSQQAAPSHLRHKAKDC